MLPGEVSDVSPEASDSDIDNQEFKRRADIAGEAAAKEARLVWMSRRLDD